MADCLGDVGVVLSTWFDGSSTEDLKACGREMFFWARIGKGIIFFAGLTVLIDFLRPDTIKGWAERCSGRIESSRRNRAAARRVRELFQLEDEIFSDLVYDDISVMDAEDPTIPHWRRKLDSPESVPPGLDMALEAYQDFHKNAVAQISKPREDANRLAEELVSQNLSVEDRVHLERAKRRLPLGRLLFNFALGCACFIAAVLALQAIPSAIGKTVLGIPILMGLLVILYAQHLPSVRYSLFIFGWKLFEAIFRVFEHIWRSQRPFHGFRVLAFVLFFFGSLLDIVSN